jgi:hypothetical protein
VVVGNNNQIYIWRKKNEAESRDCVCPPAQRRLSVMIWGWHITLLYISPVVSFLIQGTLNCSFRHLSLSIFIKSGCHVLQWGLTVAPTVLFHNLPAKSKMAAFKRNGCHNKLHCCISSWGINKHLFYDNVFLNLLFLQ